MPWLVHCADSPMPEYGCGHPVHEVHWKPGERREVNAEASEYLLTVFAGYFEPCSKPVASKKSTAPAAPAEPEVDRAMEPPPRRRAAPRKVKK